MQQAFTRRCMSCRSLRHCNTNHSSLPVIRNHPLCSPLFSININNNGRTFATKTTNKPSSNNHLVLDKDNNKETIVDKQSTKDKNENTNLSPSKALEAKIISLLNFRKEDRALELIQEVLSTPNAPAITPKAWILLFEVTRPNKKKYKAQLLNLLTLLYDSCSGGQTSKNGATIKSSLESAPLRFYRSVLRLSGDFGRVEVAKFWFQFVLKKQKELNKKATATISDDNVNEKKKVEEQQQQGALDIHCVNALLQAYGNNSETNKNRFDEAFELLTSVRSKYQLKPDVFSFTIMLNMCESMVQLKTILLLMKRYQVMPNSVSNTSVIRILLQLENEEEAIALYQSMKQSSLNDQKPTSDTIYQLIVGFKEDETQIDSLVQDMKTLGIKPTRAMSVLLARHCTKYREDLIHQLITERVDVIEKVNKDYPSVYATLLETLKATNDARLSKVQGWLRDMNIKIHNKA